MKKQVVRKATKFQLHKETIANLENGVLTDIVGGGGTGPGGTNLYTGCNTFCSCQDTK